MERPKTSQEWADIQAREERAYRESFRQFFFATFRRLDTDLIRRELAKNKDGCYFRFGNETSERLYQMLGDVKELVETCLKHKMYLHAPDADQLTAVDPTEAESFREFMSKLSKDATGEGGSDA